MRDFLPLLAVYLLASPHPLDAADRPPSFVIILADDLGWGDLGCQGHPTIRTPHLDRMAAEGMRFTQFYSAAEVCTPSRAALLTGRLPIRVGMYGDRRRVLFPDSIGGLPEEEVTLAEALRARGYATACIGKWHLGHLPRHLPARHGFDRFFGLPYSNDMGPGRDGIRGFPPVPLMRGEEVVEAPAKQPSLTRRYSQEAVRFIEEHQGRPFLLYIPHTFPHTPLHASTAFRGRSPRGLYGDVVEELDAGVGEVLAALRRLGLEKTTLVIFTSDNGPWLTQRQAGGSAGLLREGKGSTWEGGVRVPGIAWWPGTIRAGAVEPSPASTLDLFPTCLALAGIDLPTGRTIDGLDIAPVLRGRPLEGPPPPERILFHYRGSRLMAVRKGPWKAHLLTQAGYGQPQPVEHRPPLLFHVEHDPSERHDLSAERPEVVEDLLREVERHRAEVRPAPSRVDIPSARV